jgi:phosphate transport system permease protein
LPATEDKTLRAALPVYAATAFALLGIALLFAMIIAFALPALRLGAGGVFSWTWRPYSGEFGILPMLCGTLILALSALLFAWPLALMLCCRILTAPPGPLLRAVQGLIRLMTAVPTVVYGFTAVFLLAPLVRAGLGGTGMCWLTAGLMLGLLALPTMVLILEAGLRPRLERLCPGGPAVGLTRFELLWFLVIPEARNTLLAAALLGFGRMAGDTLLPLMLAGNAPQVPGRITEGLRTLAAHMALVTANEVGGAAYNSLFAAGALLLGINAITSLLLKRLAARIPS